MRQTVVTIPNPPKHTFHRRRGAVRADRSRHLLLETLEGCRILALASPPDEPLRTRAGPLDVRLGPLNADPHEDLAVLNSDGSLTTAFNRGDDNWQSAQTTPLGLGTLHGMEFALLPSDALADLAVQGPNAVTVGNRPDRYEPSRSNAAAKLIHS